MFSRHRINDVNPATESYGNQQLRRPRGGRQVRERRQQVNAAEHRFNTRPQQVQQQQQQQQQYHRPLPPSRGRQHSPSHLQTPQEYRRSSAADRPLPAVQFDSNHQFGVSLAPSRGRAPSSFPASRCSPPVSFSSVPSRTPLNTVISVRVGFASSVHIAIVSRRRNKHCDPSNPFSYIVSHVSNYTPRERVLADDPTAPMTPHNVSQALLWQITESYHFSRFLDNMNGVGSSSLQPHHRSNGNVGTSPTLPAAHVHMICEDESPYADTAQTPTAQNEALRIVLEGYMHSRVARRVRTDQHRRWGHEDLTRFCTTTADYDTMAVRLASELIQASDSFVATAHYFNEMAPHAQKDMAKTVLQGVHYLCNASSNGGRGGSLDPAYLPRALSDRIGLTEPPRLLPPPTRHHQDKYPHSPSVSEPYSESESSYDYSCSCSYTHSDNRVYTNSRSRSPSPAPIQPTVVVAQRKTTKQPRSSSFSANAPSRRQRPCTPASPVYNNSRSRSPSPVPTQPTVVVAQRETTKRPRSPSFSADGPSRRQRPCTIASPRRRSPSPVVMHVVRHSRSRSISRSRSYSPSRSRSQSPLCPPLKSQSPAVSSCVTSSLPPPSSGVDDTTVNKIESSDHTTYAVEITEEWPTNHSQSHRPPSPSPPPPTPRPDTAISIATTAATADIATTTAAAVAADIATTTTTAAATTGVATAIRKPKRRRVSNSGSVLTVSVPGIAVSPLLTPSIEPIVPVAEPIVTFQDKDLFATPEEDVTTTPAVAVVAATAQQTPVKKRKRHRRRNSDKPRRKHRRSRKRNTKTEPVAVPCDETPSVPPAKVSPPTITNTTVDDILAAADTMLMETEDLSEEIDLGFSSQEDEEGAFRS